MYEVNLILICNILVFKCQYHSNGRSWASVLENSDIPLCLYICSTLNDI